MPLYVDPTSGADTALGGFKIQACLASPDVPAAIGGAPGGLRLIEAYLDFTNVFTNPSASGTYTWRVFDTPFTPGTATPDPTGTVEARSLVGLPKLFSLKWALNAIKTRVTLTGKVTEAGKPRAGVNVRFLGGPQKGFDTWKALGVAKTKADGSFSFTRAVTGSHLRLRARQPVHQRLVHGARLDGAAGLRVRVDRPLVRAGASHHGAEGQEEVRLVSSRP